MINEKDVIRMKVPYPTISDTLAVSAHMYICRTVQGSLREFVKCQTMKPYMLTNKTMQHFCDEKPGISRNPFQKITRIDCEKLFFTSNVKYDNSLRTTTRPDICDDLIQRVNAELAADGHMRIPIKANELMHLNRLVYAI